MTFLSLVFLAWLAAKLFRVISVRAFTMPVFRLYMPVAFDGAAVVWVGTIAVYSVATMSGGHPCTNLHALPVAFKVAGAVFGFLLVQSACMRVNRCQ